MKKNGLTAEDLSTLSRALTLKDRFDDAGIFPIGAGQTAHFKRLCRLGLLEFDEYGRDIDGEVERDVPIYRLTEAGAVAARGA